MIELPPSLDGATNVEVMSNGFGLGLLIASVNAVGVSGTVGVTIVTALPEVELPTLFMD